jgi:hypothetical protein
LANHYQQKAGIPSLLFFACPRWLYWFAKPSFPRGYLFVKFEDKAMLA